MQKFVLIWTFVLLSNSNVLSSQNCIGCEHFEGFLNRLAYLDEKFQMDTHKALRIEHLLKNCSLCKGKPSLVKFIYQNRNTTKCPGMFLNCDSHAECFNIGFEKYECRCQVGWAGNGWKCGKDSDNDGYPDKSLSCCSLHCKQKTVL